MSDKPTTKRWAVSVVLTQHKPDGNINILNNLREVRATSKDEAVGMALGEVTKRFPDHQIHCYTVLQFE